MLSIGWLVAAVLVAILLTTWVIFTVTRLDRLHARVDAAQAALDAQLVRRAAAVLHLAEMPGSGITDGRALDLAHTARHALTTEAADRRAAENGVSRAITDLMPIRSQLPGAIVAEVSEATTRVLIARRFFNDAVRDTRTLRARRMPRLLHLAGHRDLPQYFDIDDSSLLDDPDPGPVPSAPEGTTA